MNALQKLNSRIEKANSLLCVGLDSDLKQLPPQFKDKKFPQFEFNKWIIDQTHEYVCAYKPNTAFYEARGWQGWRELELTIEYIRKNYPDIFTICDAKRADIGSTNQGYVTAVFDQMGFDAVTVNPYLGSEAIQPFLDRKDKAIIILCRTSNPGSGELQELLVSHPEPGYQPSVSGSDKGEILKRLTASRQVQNEGNVPLWQVIAHKVANEWNENQNCMLVVGATYPQELARVRENVGEMTLLVPGIGAQGGEVAATVQAGLNSAKKGMIINSSRGIIFAKDPKKAAQSFQEEINNFR